MVPYHFDGDVKRVQNASKLYSRTQEENYERNYVEML
jgi:hypothetical protein